MKRFFGFALMLALVAAPAFASKKSESVNIPIPVLVGSTQLRAGDYKLTWTGAGSDVQATLAQNGKAVATFPAKVVEGKSNPGLETRAKGGTEVLETIHLSNLSLSLEDAPAK